MKKTQKYVDDFYLKNGDCCAGCDHWRFLNSYVGECMKSAPVSGDDRISILDLERVSMSIEVGSGHVMTKRDHLCGYFVDTYDWNSST
jgi:hypothetical protein